ncbi:cobalamin biosynthesis protein CbiM [Hornefia porci]|uniref:Cobalamin biosynthesis protein CbiM n=1 Tax=Hornefia porci TaxID=2652292 RepID=A0A1Q9JGX7_9FIRM|nr:cobalt transporter CbiM [Hornefia porci]OLR55462.1 cobalamin biosynthesis protein CbiM [Hornefia porci]
MHIPDGYMAPQTTIPALAVMVPVWGAAAKKVTKEVGEKNLPTLALGAAFSFTVMMMNVPVIGGSSAHAVGAVMVGILLGPWSAVIAVSCALLIQALIFGDGGILAFGMNCLNMAVIMPFTGYGIYKLIEGKNKIGSSRSILGAAVGGYAGLNIAAFCASVEFGIQPLLFHAADGSALYCPYPLSVSIPAMMVPHLLIAGVIEGAVTAIAIAYIAKVSPQIFLRNQELSPMTQETQTEPFFRRYKKILIPLGVLVLLTPLGLLASGTAWGEWGTEEIKALTGYVPKGFARFADWWTAIMPDYSVAGLGDVSGYILSAVVGILLIAVLILALSLFMKKSGRREQ